MQTSGGSKGTPGTRPQGPNSFNFMQFLGKFGKIVCWRAPWGVGAPSSGKSWIRHCKLFWNAQVRLASQIAIVISGNYVIFDLWSRKSFSANNALKFLNKQCVKSFKIMSDLSPCWGSIWHAWVNKHHAPSSLSGLPVPRFVKENHDWAVNMCRAIADRRVALHHPLNIHKEWSHRLYYPIST